MSATLETRLPAVPDGPMSVAEASFCRQVREAMQKVRDGEVPFIAIMANLWSDLTQIRKSGWSVDTAVAGGFKPSISAPTVSLRSGPSASERAFVGDMDGFLDYAMRNGLGFIAVLAILWHDIAELAAHGFSLERASQEFFLPKSSGWAERNTALLRPAEEVPE